MGTIIVAAIVALCFGFAIFNTVKKHKSGGCSGCSGCHGECNTSDSNPL